MSIAKRFWVWIKRFGSLGSSARSRLRRELTTRLRPSGRRLLRLEPLDARMLLAATVFTDHADYAPGSTAFITAASDGAADHNFAVGEAIQFQVSRTDGISDHAPGNLPWVVVDGSSGFTPYQDPSGQWIYPDLDAVANGQVETSWYVDRQYANAKLLLTATGLSTGEVATHAFTDSAIVISSDMNWSAITGGSGTNGAPTTADTITINAGVTLTVDVASAVSGALTNNGTLAVGNGNAVALGSLAAAGGVSLGDASSALTVGAANTSTTYSGVISGAGTVTKVGTGTWTVSGNSTYTGATTISAGRLTLGAPGTSPNSPLGTVDGATTVASGAALNLNGRTLATAEPLTISGTGVASSGALTNSSPTAATYSGLLTLGAASTVKALSGNIILSNTGTIMGSGFTLTLDGEIGGSLASILGTGTGGLTKAGTGTWTVSGNSTYMGATTISAGTLKLGSAGDSTNSPLGTVAGSTSIASGAALDLNGYALGTAESITISGSGVSSGGALTNNNPGTTATYSGLLTLGAASTVKASSGNIILSNTGTITGATFGLTLDGTASGSSLASILGTGTGGLTKSGTGTWTVSGASTYTGATSISAGTLLINGSLASGSAVSVAAGATLGGSGTAAGGVTASGSISPGASYGSTDTAILNVGATTFTSGSGLKIDINGTTAGTGHDQLLATGNISLGSSGVLSVAVATGYVPTFGSTYTILSTPAGTISGTFSGLANNATFTANGYSFRITYNTTSVVLTALEAPAITTQPTSSTVLAGDTATFTAAASGTPTPTVQWQIRTNGGASWNDISGATSTTYSFTTVSGDNGNQYRAVFTNTVGAATTDPATLTVNYAPSVTQNPSSSTVNSGSTASFTAAATGNPTSTIQWQVSTNGGASWSNISGATSTTYSFTTVSGDNGNQYRAVFTNTVGSATSSAAVLSVVTLDVSRGQVQRSYVRYLDITTGQGSDASQIVSSSRIRLRKADLNGNGSVNVPLTGLLSANGANISVDFGAAGIQNSRNTNGGDGYYTLELDLDNDTVFETSLRFYRLLGDVNGDKQVNSADQTAVTAASGTSNPQYDLNGDGIVNSTDVLMVRRALGRRLASGLVVDD
jgi:autotransporter-associated beta strand protein